MSNITHIGTLQFVCLAAGAVIGIALPAVIAILWKIRKKEPVTTILIGAAAFLLFVLILAACALIWYLINTYL